MRDKESNGIEFEVWTTDEKELQISRKSFRAPMGDSSEVWLRINDQLFEIVNMTPSGIGIHLKDSGFFKVDQIIDTIILHLEGTILKFKGKVSHISPMDPDGFLYGIALIESLDDNKAMLQRYIQKTLNRLITDSITKPDGEIEGDRQ